MDERITPQSAQALLAKAGGQRWVTLWKHGADPQQPHTRDECYFVISGSGWFVLAGERRRFAAGEVLFVAAGVPHRFEEFSDDFATWAVFVG